MMQGIKVKAYTRWHQWSVPIGLLIASAAFLGLLFGMQQPLWAIGAAIVGLIVPPLVAFQGFPTSNEARVDTEGLSFSRRGPVPFSEIASWSADDYLKLARPGKPTLLVGAIDGPNRERLLREFQAGLSAWQTRQPGAGQGARQTYFYGSWRARLVGALIIALGGAVMAMALRLTEPNVMLASVGALGALFGVAMLLGKRRGH